MSKRDVDELVSRWGYTTEIVKKVTSALGITPGDVLDHLERGADGRYSESVRRMLAPVWEEIPTNGPADTKMTSAAVLGFAGVPLTTKNPSARLKKAHELGASCRNPVAEDERLEKPLTSV